MAITRDRKISRGEEARACLSLIKTVENDKIISSRRYFEYSEILYHFVFIASKSTQSFNIVWYVFLELLSTQSHKIYYKKLQNSVSNRSTCKIAADAHQNKLRYCHWRFPEEIFKLLNLRVLSPNTDDANMRSISISGIKSYLRTECMPIFRLF